MISGLIVHPIRHIRVSDSSTQERSSNEGSGEQVLEWTVDDGDPNCLAGLRDNLFTLRWHPHRPAVSGLAALQALSSADDEPPGESQCACRCPQGSVVVSKSNPVRRTGGDGEMTIRLLRLDCIFCRENEGDRTPSTG